MKAMLENKSLIFGAHWAQLYWHCLCFHWIIITCEGFLKIGMAYNRVVEHIENSLFKEKRCFFLAAEHVTCTDSASETACVRSLHTHGAKQFHFMGDWDVCPGVCPGSVLCPMKAMAHWFAWDSSEKISLEGRLKHNFWTSSSCRLGFHPPLCFLLP